MLISRAFVLLIFACACGGRIDSGLGDAGSDASPKPDSGPEPPPSADAAPPPSGDCTNLDLAGVPVPIEQVAEDTPPVSATGGSISTGIYQLTSFTIFTGPNGASGQAGTVDARIRVTSAKDGWNVESIASTNQEAPQESASAAVISAPGALAVTTYCPSLSPTENVPYSFDGVKLTLFVSDTEEQFTLVTK